MAETKELTDRELNIMAMAWLCFTEQPKPDFEKLGPLCGFTNPKSAANAWSVIKKKLVHKASIAGDNAGQPARPTPKKSTPRKRGKKAEGENQGSPAKKAKGRQGKSSSAAKVEPEDEEDDEANSGNEDEHDGKVKAEETDEEAEDEMDEI